MEISFAYHDGRLHLLAFGWSQWVRNVKAHPAVEARVGSLKLSLEATFPEAQEAAVEQTRELFRAKYGDEYLRRWYRGSDWWPVVLTVKAVEQGLRRAPHA